MKHSTFVRLYEEAHEYTELELFIGERGWQGWMDTLTPDQIVKYLTLIFEMAKKDYRGLREMAFPAKIGVHQAYHIPLRTLDGWESKVPSSTRKMTNYLECFYAFAIFSEIIYTEEVDQ